MGEEMVGRVDHEVTDVTCVCVGISVGSLIQFDQCKPYF